MAQCTNATITGRYVFIENGFETKRKDHVPLSYAGYQLNRVKPNGDGEFEGVTSYSENGKIGTMEALSGTYKVNTNCTGTLTYTDGTEYDMFIAPDGSMFTFVQTNPKRFAATGTATRVGTD